MISYSQNGEDVLLNRLFGHQAAGTYIDVGAGHPWIDSVTQHFYAQGWTGINIEPRPEMLELLSQHRQRDVNLQCCVSDHPGVQKFFHIHWAGFDEVGEDGGGLSTLDPQAALRFKNDAVTIREYDVQVRTLTEICRTYCVDTIDFLKVDVEGHERQVLRGLDLQLFRPRVLVIEATLPLTSKPCHHSWEPLILSADYLFAANDGVNRYYVRAEDRALLPLLRSPVGPQDNFIKHRQMAQQCTDTPCPEVTEEEPELPRTFTGRVARLLTGCLPPQARDWLRQRRVA